jgi:hypothetical protein
MWSSRVGWCRQDDYIILNGVVKVTVSEKAAFTKKKRKKEKKNLRGERGNTVHMEEGEAVHSRKRQQAEKSQCYCG